MVESEEMTMLIAREVARIGADYDLDLIFKASYRKANRTSGNSFSGIGDKAGAGDTGKGPEDIRGKGDHRRTLC